jgi:predicted  nucleic acid-binding Zn-ribbon protein
MIKKLHELKKMQTDQKLIEKGQLMARISRIEDEIKFTEKKINTTSVQKHGAISDFAVLAIHKNTMKEHIVKLNNEKIVLQKQVESLVIEIVELQKQTEQYAYILKEQKDEAFRKVLYMEEEASSEYIQSKYISEQENF